MKMQLRDHLYVKVRTLREAHIILKNLQLICQNHEEDFFKFCVLFRKSELYVRVFCLFFLNVRTISVHKVRGISQFLNHPSTPISLRIIKMVHKAKCMHSKSYYLEVVMKLSTSGQQIISAF